MVFSTQEFFLFTRELIHFTQEILPLLPKKLRTSYSRNLRVPINLIYKNQCLSVSLSLSLSLSLSVSYRSPHRSSDCDETFTSCCKHPGVVLEIKKNENCTNWSTRCCTFPTRARTVHPITMKISEIVVHMLTVVFEI